MPGHSIEVRPGPARVRVSIAGQTVADSRRVLVLDESNLPLRYYLPLEDVRTELLIGSDTHTHCPFKGDAGYYSVRSGDEVHSDVVWFYDDPLPGVEAIRGRVAFYEERPGVEIETE